MSSRHSDDALASKGLDLLRQQLVLRVALAQLAKAPKAPTPEGAVGGEGEAVVASRRHSDDALAGQQRPRSSFVGSGWACRGREQQRAGAVWPERI